ncbi:class I tRNA ligase family protein, partial [Candidatus Sumerlaeota bacterium]|nr:class I tRNA ligase family protein [Candidatus Sumerlaeota bacterium]
MTLVIYNTLTRGKEPFEPLDPGKKRITFYNCGPTVYDRFHIGNARNFVTTDIIRCYLEWLGYEVVFIQNLTDIDDKIIKRAQRDKTTPEAIAAIYTAAYFEDADRLRLRRATEHPRATQYVEQMIEFMREMESRGLAYEAGGSLYFRVRRCADYGKLARRTLDDLLEGALLLPTAWLVAALWRPLARARWRLGLHRLPRSADLIIVMGTVTLPFLAAAVRIPLGGVELGDSWIGTHAITLWIVALLVSSLVVVLLWDWRRFVPIAVIAAVIIVPLFTTSFTNVGGLRSGFW